MKSVLFSIFSLLFFVSVVSAKPKIKNFVLSEVISGSWLISQKVYSAASNGIVEDYGITQYNISKSEIPSEYKFVRVDPSTGKKLPESFEYIVAATSNTTGIVRKYDPSAEEEITDLFNLIIQNQLAGEIDSAFGSIPNTDYTYEFTIYNHDHAVLKIIDHNVNEMTIISAIKIPQVKKLSWFRRYGPYVLLGVGVGMQFLLMLCQ